MLATSTVHRSPSKPGWQTDELDDEWIEPPSSRDPDDSHSNDSRTHSLFDDVAPPSASLSRVTALPSSTPPGTFLIREDQLPMSKPLGKGRGKALMKDFFSPLALETMFEPPSPNIVGDTLPAAPSSVAQVSAAGDGGQHPSGEDLTLEAVQQVKDDGLGEGDMEEETRPNEGSGEREENGDADDAIVASDIPNLVSFNGRKLSSAYKFTFSAPRPTRVPSPVHEGTPSAPPIPARRAPRSQPQAPATDPRLRLFQFQYDTFTREHLSAMVDSIAVHTPSSNASHSRPPANRPPRQQQPASPPEHLDDAYLRATKRLKLTPPQDLSGDGAPALPKPRKDYVGESRNLMQKIKQARSLSMMTTASVKENIQATNVEDQSTVEDRPRRVPFGEGV